jgi:glycosyltransferase involved in cell wall biosynthesis
MGVTNEKNPDVSVVTPSRNMGSYIWRCHNSVADQEGVEVEHIVMDAESNDGTLDWLKKQDGLTWRSEPDAGMYDAVNKGWGLSHGQIRAYLNCDEQYLPGTLRFVKEYFDRHPEVDVLFGDILVVDPDGCLLSFRKGYQPRMSYILAGHLYVFSCAMFFRRKILDDGFRFNSRYKTVADADLVIRLLRNRYSARHVRRYLSVFTWTGGNLSASGQASEEEAKLLASGPFWVRMLRCAVNGIRLLHKLFSGAYFQRFPVEYYIYAGQSADRRTRCVARSGSWKWPG